MTITLTGLKDGFPKDIVVGATAAIGDKTYTTVIDNVGSYGEDSYRSAFNGGWYVVEIVTFEEGVKVLNAEHLFDDFQELTSVNASVLDMSACSNTSGMFLWCGKLATLDLSKWVATSVDENGGWQYAFKNVDSVANNGLIKEKNSPTSDGKYIGFDFVGNYGMLLEDSMDAIVASKFESIDYDNIVINYYAPENSDHQNLICLHTAATGMLKVSKEIATGSDVDTTQQFKFTVKLSLNDNPLTRVVFVKNEGDAEFQRVTPNENGEITLTTTGAGEAWIENLPTGVNFIVTELYVDSWKLVSSNSVQGVIAKNEVVAATFTNGETTSATVNKVWDDEGDRYQKRPESITVTLPNGAKVILNAENNWTATVDGLWKCDAYGVLIVHTWTEDDMPEGYTLSDTSVDGTVTTLTNSYTAKKGNGGGNNAGQDNKAMKAAGASGGNGGMTQTGDALPVLPLAVLALVSFAALATAASRQRDC